MTSGRAHVIQGFFPHGLARLTGGGAVVQRLAGGTAVRLEPRDPHLFAGAGHPLPQAVQLKMEALFGARFSDVRVHVGPQVASIGALAFTRGSDVWFATGQYDSNSVRGHRLIAHELAHVVQQRSGRVRNPFGSGAAVVHDQLLEAEAERMALRASTMPLPLPLPLPVQAKLVRPLQLRAPGAGRVAQRASSSTQGSSSNSGLSGGGGAKVCYRFCDLSAGSYKSALARNDPGEYAKFVKKYLEWYADIGSDPEFGTIFAQHMAGANDDDSPFLSMTTDPEKAARTTDTSRGGLRSIVDNAPIILAVDLSTLPAAYVTVAVGSGLQASEGEVLVLLPPGKSLTDYPHHNFENPYLVRDRSGRFANYKPSGLLLRPTRPSSSAAATDRG